MGTAGVTIDGSHVSSAQRTLRSAKSLSRIEPPEVKIRVKGLSTEQIESISRQVEALDGVGVPPRTDTHIRVICRDINAYLRIYRKVESIIEDVT